MDPPVFQVAIKWWLGLDTSEGSQCALCPGSALDHLGHHAVTCKYGGDVVSRHNRIRDILVETCRRAHIGVKVEVGNNLSRDHSKTRPANILHPNWFLGRTAALSPHRLILSLCWKRECRPQLLPRPPRLESTKQMTLNVQI